MKRTAPLLIMFISGMVLIVSTFVPPAEELKEDITVWFDILAAVAFVLGGGNLLMMHLSKISKLRAGWGYSAVTLVAFLVTLAVGMFKLGATPAESTEAFGTVMVSLALPDFPVQSAAPGSIPPDQRGPISRFFKPQSLPPITEGQLSTGKADEKPGVVFRGWMRKNQHEALRKYRLDNSWHKTVDELFEQTKPPKELKSRVVYNAQLETLNFEGKMTAAEQDILLKLGEQNKPWQEAINQLFTLSNQSHVVSLAGLPSSQAEFMAGISIPEKLQSYFTLDADNELKVTGPMLPKDRDTLKKLSQTQPGTMLTQAEKKELQTELLKRGPLTESQSEQLQLFDDSAKTAGLRNKELLFRLLTPVTDIEGKLQLTPDQKQFLMSIYNDEELPWQQKVDELFYLSQQEKYAWSGNYNPEGSGFWYIFEYILIPLTATMFALLAFYVASAAFRAFRAKNTEATLLLVTAFLILLGNTYAGTVLTGWLPDAGPDAGWFAQLIAGLKLSNLSAIIMRVFNTAGTRAIMIGIALGIASTSLKVLLGIDRSYLGSD